MNKFYITAFVVSALAIITLSLFLYATSNTLKAVRGELAASQTARQKTETEKKNLENELEDIQSTLGATRLELSQTQEILQNASEAARNIATERNALREEKSTLEQEKQQLRTKLNEIEAELKRIRIQSQRSIVAIQEKFKDTVGAVLDDAGRLKLDVKGKILFETGKATLSAEGKQLLDAIAQEVLLNPNYADYIIRIEGHTDNTPIGGDALRNWELSTDRAVAAVKYLQVHANVDAHRLTATGHAFYQPIYRANTSEAKAKNRRIEIILVPPQDFLLELLTSVQNVMKSLQKTESQQE